MILRVIARYLTLIWMFVRVCIQDTAAYRMDFLFHIFTAVIQLGFELVVVQVIFAQTQSLAGWNVLEILVLLGVYRMMTGVITLFIAPNMRLLMEDIREGTLDFILLKPVDTQFYASVRKIVVWRLADILLGASLAIYACVKLSVSLSIGTLALFVLMLGSGIAIIYSFWLVLGTCAFWFTRITNIEMVFWNVFEAGRYPVHIYRPAVRWGLTYIVPLAFLTTFPAGSLVGKTQLSGAFAAVALATAAIVGSSLFWRWGVRNYSGASA
jgi:ABC-2 type transport system permease protein